MGEQPRPNEIDEAARFFAEEFAFAHDDAVAALGKVLAHVAHGEALAIGIGDADAGDDGDAEAHGDVFFDDVPSADFDGDLIGHLALLEDEIDQAIGGEALRRKDQAVGGKIFQQHVFFVRERVIERRDEHGVVVVDGRPGDVVGDIEHGADGEIRFFIAQQREAVFAGDVGELQMHGGVALAVLAHEVGQQVLDGGTASGDGELASGEAFDLGLEIAVETLPPFHEGTREFVEHFAGIGEVDAAAAAMEQFHAEFALQRLQLEADGGLREVERFGGATERAELYGGDEGAHLLEAVAFVVEAAGVGGWPGGSARTLFGDFGGCWGHGLSSPLPSPPLLHVGEGMDGTPVKFAAGPYDEELLLGVGMLGGIGFSCWLRWAPSPARRGGLGWGGLPNSSASKGGMGLKQLGGTEFLVCAPHFFLVLSLIYMLY